MDSPSSPSKTPTLPPLEVIAIDVDEADEDDTSDEDFVLDEHESDAGSVISLDSSSSDQESNDNPPPRRPTKTKTKKAKANSDDDNREVSPPVADTADTQDGENTGVMTRSRRKKLAETTPKFPEITTESTSTLDVSAIWNRIRSDPIDIHGRSSRQALGSKSSLTDIQQNQESSSTTATTTTTTDLNKYDDKYITIKHSFVFAGQAKSEEKRVLKSSAEAKVYLSTLASANRKKRLSKAGAVVGDGVAADDISNINSNTATTISTGINDVQGPTSLSESNIQARNRPLKRLSRFDPNPIGIVRTLPPELQLRWPREPTFSTLLQQYQAQTTPGQTPIVGPRRGRGGGMTVFSTRGRGGLRGRAGGVGSRGGGNRGGSSTGGFYGTSNSNHHAMSSPFPGSGPLQQQQPAKLNTIEKSRYDWAGYVDQAGIGDELDQYGKAKESYFGRTNFLAESDIRREAMRKQTKGRGNEKG